ncbi:hypothetical protein F2Q69_00000243 [Brassica cretica]|uniref:Uncharacterized protein n=1 Tax=Brassica cretica TaxID=69181 RepID=A0A8S9P751_BRACR|nr:hypothetical protein F2Q69_00000243 [Brassica cretica]
MNLVNPRLPSCSSRRDESVATNHASIGVRTKPHAPPKVTPLRAREVHAPPPENVATAGPPSPDAGISAVAAVDRCRYLPGDSVNSSESTQFGVHLSSWRSYIPLLFIAKVSAIPLNPELV